MTNRIFFADLYGYDQKEYNNKIDWACDYYINEVNNTWDLLETDVESWTHLKTVIRLNKEEEEKEITEIFLKTRIIKWDPLFDYLKNWGLVKIIPLDHNQK